MYTLAYLTKSMTLDFMQVENFESCIDIPQDLIFVAIRDGNQTIFDPDNSINFTDVERLIIGLRGSFDLSFLKDSDFRKENTKLCPAPKVLPSFVEKYNFNLKWMRDEGDEQIYFNTCDTTNLRACFSLDGKIFNYIAPKFSYLESPEGIEYTGGQNCIYRGNPATISLAHWRIPEFKNQAGNDTLPFVSMRFWDELNNVYSPIFPSTILY